MAKPKSRKRRHLPEPAWEHPSRDRSDRFALDALIREAGFSIFRRKGDRPPLWVRSGCIYSQAEVLTVLDDGKVVDAELLETLYWEGVPSVIELGGAP